MTSDELYLKIANYCAYQDRSVAEVLKKMNDWQVPLEFHETFIELLISENYLNQERYASSYIRGKSQLKKWGKNKIKIHLQQKGIPQELIQEKLNDLNTEDYLHIATKIAQTKLVSLQKETDKRVLKQKILRHLIGKGYEFDIAQKAYNLAIENNYD
ncbi:MAG: regulatory protein RecX [Cytophagales bacterium]